ncbi:MAG: InlB B-repeat-containing protein, partial [Firmicutes bacterium]|nr:InlB B-repeat-containing protein [Bacillota bacterium]
MKLKFRKILALVMTVAMVATTVTFTAGNTLQAEEQSTAPAVSQETSEPAKAEPAESEKSEPVTETQKIVVESDSAADSDSDRESTESEPAEVDSNQAADEEQEKQAEEQEEIKMPSQHFSDRAGNGITVDVSAPEGAFPEGTTMKVTAVSHAKAVSMVEDTVDGVQDANGVDITFFNDGKEIQPEKNISVKLGNAGVDGDNFSVYHVGNNKSVDKVTDNASTNGASFKADDFSIYIVVGQEETQVIPDSLKVNFRFVNSSRSELGAPDTVYIEKNEQGKYEIEYTIPEFEGKTAESVDCYGADFAISSDGTKVTATVDAAEDDSVQQEASCDIIYVSQKAEYTVKHVFEKEGADSDTPESERFEARADVPDITLEGEIGTETEATAQVINGFTAQEIDQEIISGDAEQPTVVTIKYDRNKYFLTYDTQGGSYVKGKTISYGSSVDVYSKNDSKLTCTKEEHTHSAVPAASANNNKGKTIGCYTSTWPWGSWNYEWVLSCNKNEHTHDSSCYSSAISSPIPSRQGYTFGGWYSDAGCTEEAPQTIDSVEGDYTVYAKWVPKNVNYTVVVRKENVDGSYSFVTSSTKTA